MPANHGRGCGDPRHPEDRRRLCEESRPAPPLALEHIYAVDLLGKADPAAHFPSTQPNSSGRTGAGRAGLGPTDAKALREHFRGRSTYSSTTTGTASRARRRQREASSFGALPGLTWSGRETRTAR